MFEQAARRECRGERLRPVAVEVVDVGELAVAVEGHLVAVEEVRTGACGNLGDRVQVPVVVDDPVRCHVDEDVGHGEVDEHDTDLLLVERGEQLVERGDVGCIEHVVRHLVGLLLAMVAGFVGDEVVEAREVVPVGSSLLMRTSEHGITEAIGILHEVPDPQIAR